MRNNLSSKLLHWYDRHHRDLPWRVPPDAVARGVTPEPYRVWLSEIMLQQTTAEAVKRYFQAFTTRWPTIGDLAAADLEDVLKEWAGLGYYSRARNLKKAAEAVVTEFGGTFPQTASGLSTLPGVGRYTSAAIASIAFGEPVTVVDGNVERVVTRLEAIATPLPQAKPQIHEFLEAILPRERPGDFAQACMDLGATICTPRKPKCILCPLREECEGLRGGEPELFPVKLAKADKPLRKGAAFVAVRSDFAVLLTKREDIGLLAGMSCVPTSNWTARQDGATGVEAAPLAADWRDMGEISHVFTHFALRLEVWLAQTSGIAPNGHWWSEPKDLPHEALPTLFKKAIEKALPHATRKTRS